jgi:hypothetical protein
MDRRAALALCLYAVVVATTGVLLYEDDVVSYLVVLAAAHIGVGLGVGRWWVIVVPVVFTVLAVALAQHDGIVFVLVLAVVPLVLLTAVGWALSHGPRWLVAGGLAICAGAVIVPAALAQVQRAKRGPHVSAALQRQLPVRESLGNLCPGAETPADVEREIRAGADVLLRELRRRPDDLVTYTYYYSDGGGTDTRDITIRQLAKEQLADLEAGGRDCAPDLQRRLHAAL